MNSFVAHIIVILLLLNVPTILLETTSISISSPVSIASFILMTILIFRSRNVVLYPLQIKLFALMGFLYFFIGSIWYFGDYNALLISFIKYILYLFGIYSCLHYVKIKNIIIILTIGAFTILLDSLFFRFNDFIGDGYVSEYGRYAGFYLNPNTASIICLFGYVVTLNQKKIFKFLGILFLLMGFLTLSRTFIITSILITFIFYHNRIKTLILLPVFALGILFLLTTFSSELKLESNRFNFLTGLFSGNIDYNVLEEDSRQDQWAKYYNKIIDSPFTGNGYGSFSGGNSNLASEQGIHNSILLIMGESGIIPFLFCIFLLVSLFSKSLKFISQNLSPLLLFIVFFIQLIVNHNFFESAILIFVLCYLVNKIIKPKLNN